MNQGCRRIATELFGRYQRSEKALVSALAEMYVQGASTRKVRAITAELCGHAFSASAISEINKKPTGSCSSSLSESSRRTILEGLPAVAQGTRAVRRGAGRERGPPGTS